MPDRETWQVLEKQIEKEQKTGNSGELLRECGCDEKLFAFRAFRNGLASLQRKEKMEREEKSLLNAISNHDRFQNLRDPLHIPLPLHL